jgi:altronate dehydratase large subunit
MKTTFLGYPRPDGSAGVRNYTLILPVNRSLNFIASYVAKMVRGVKHFEIPGEGGRPERDRETIVRTAVGLAANANVGGILLLAVRPDYGYKNMSLGYFLDTIKATGKPFRTVVLTEEGGSYKMLGETLRVARELAHEVSKTHRAICDVGKLCFGVKCGMSDPTSGMVGNPVMGHAFDLLIRTGGTGFFGETTEIIGAEEILAQRAATPEVARKIIAAARHWEEKAQSTGEDIRTINPIPANIAAGITTLEEKSLGAIAKGGSTAIQDVLLYGERPKGKGLYFIDSWMSSLSLPLCFAASGATIIMLQLGGGDMAEAYPMMPAINPTIVSPWLYTTGNKHTYKKSPDNIDFDSSPALDGGRSVQEMGEALFDHLVDVASGTSTKMETLNYQEKLEVYMEGPVL